jgi:hypothetical protein
MILSFRPNYDPGVDSASNRNEYKEYHLGEGVKRPVSRADNFALFCVDYPEILEVSTSWRPKGLFRPL